MPISALEGVSGLRDPSTEKSQTGERLTAYLDDARGDLSCNTVRAMRADLERFTAWCAERGLCSLPARAATVVAYIEAMASVRAPATVRRYVSSVAAVHRAAGEKSPLEHVTVRRALKGIHRQRGCRQTQVQGLTWALRRRLLEAAGNRMIDVRNRAILAVAYDAMLRRSELVALQVVDVTRERGGSASLLVRRAKNDPEAAGAMLYLHRDSVKLLSAWLSASGVAGGPLFRSLRKDGTVGGRLPAGQVPRIYKAWNEELRGRVRADEPRKDGASGDLGFREDQVSEDISRPQRPNSSPNSWDSEVRRSALTTAVPACPTLQTHHWLPVVDVLTDPPC